MPLLLQLILIVVAFLSHEHEAIAQYVPSYTSTVVPVNKHIDTVNPLYSASITAAYINTQTLNANFLIDIDAPFNWHNCILQWNIYPDGCPATTPCTYPVSCEEHVCTDVRTTYSHVNPTCPPLTNDSTLPGWGYCTCPVTVIDPVTRSCGQALLDYDEFIMKTSNGRNVTGTYSVYPNAACAPYSSFESFPANVTGVMALSTLPHALPAYLFQPIKRIVALCLPSTLSAPGVLFFGTGPYYVRRPQSDLDVRSLVSYTPLMKHPYSFGYFIGVNAIVIKKRSIDVLGNATAKLSTTNPYTALRTDLYKWVVRRFSMVTKRIPSAKSVAPFGLCFSTFFNGSRVGLKVPDIDFSLRDGKKWSISTANSIKQITKDVACLAFVDGGATTEPPVVIGTFQFEDNFLVFDLENSSFGFSSSLLRKHTSCANFNFTLT